MIDLNRGVSKRSVYTKNGILQVCMYKDQPGVYLNERGEEYPPEQAARYAKKAGFDVEEMEKLRQRNEKLAEARLRIDEEMALEPKKEQPPKKRAGRPRKVDQTEETPEETPGDEPENVSDTPAQAGDNLTAGQNT